MVIVPSMSDMNMISPSNGANKKAYICADCSSSVCIQPNTSMSINTCYMCSSSKHCNYVTSRDMVSRVIFKA